MAKITIVGSGIIGLAIASQLSRHHEITVIARDLPGDEPSIKWASPWAGANFVAGGCSSARERRMQMDAFTELWRLAIRHPESSVKRLPMEEFYDNERSDDDFWFKDFIPGFRFLPKDQLPEGVRGGITYMTIVVNPHIFMPWLKRNLESSGVKFRRMDLDSLSDAHHLGHDVLINATGEGPKYLSDIKDQNMDLLRGQTMIIKSGYKKSFMRDDGNTYTYVIPPSRWNGNSWGEYETQMLRTPRWILRSTKILLQESTEACQNTSPLTLPTTRSWVTMWAYGHTGLLGCASKRRRRTVKALSMPTVLLEEALSTALGLRGKL
ncbi:hypothetical protein FALCPG4_002422 [Fusarium falciforme]